MKTWCFAIALVAVTLFTSMSAQALSVRPNDGAALGPNDMPVTTANPKCLEVVAAINIAEMNVSTQASEFSKIVRDPVGGGVAEYRDFRANTLGPKSAKYVDALKTRAVLFDRLKALKCPLITKPLPGRIPDAQK